MSPKKHYLQQKNGQWRYRRRYPRSVQSRAKGEFYIRHLRTAVLEVAVAMRPGCDAVFLAEVKRLEASIDLRPRPLDENEALALFARWMPMEAAEWNLCIPERRDEALIAECLTDFNGLESECRTMLRYGAYEDIEGIAQNYLDQEGIKALPSSPGYRKLVELMVRGWQFLSKRSAARLDGNFDLMPDDQAVAAALAEVPHDPPAPTVADLIDRYVKRKEKDWSISTSNAYQPVFRVLREVLGPSRSVGSITRADGVRLFETVCSLPASLSKKPSLRGLSIADAVEKAKYQGLPTLNAKTINDSYLCLLRSIFKFAKQEHWISETPMDGLRVADPVHDDDRRDPFTTAQLKEVFHGPPWALGFNACASDPIDYWGPLIAVFSGMRRGEIAQLNVTDVTRERGIDVFLVKAGNQKRLKTKKARRMIPLHRELVRAGFLEFVARQQANGCDQLFPGQKPNCKGQWGREFGDRFGRMLVRRKISGNKLGLHSFRHNFEDALREADLHDSAIGNYLAGRTGGGTSGNYGSMYGSTKLANAMDKIEYEDLDLSHLYSVRHTSCRIAHGTDEAECATQQSATI